MNTKTAAKPAAAERVKTGGLGARLRAWREQHLYSLVSSFGRLARRPFATGLTVGVMAIAIALPLGLGLALGNIERFSGSVSESREIGSVPTSPPSWCARRKKASRNSAR
jgi:cell division transport system permease protein